jgi:alkanesulfonate monooxygenase SsuD/methylene tetrahydromethanopterin reductase-like flavin-dependent oxidoreductase (luciferase family)
VTQVRFGVGLFATENASEGVRLAQRADALSFDRFWVGDSHMIWREAFVMLGAIASTTNRIQIGPGVTHPVVRQMTVIASAMARSTNSRPVALYWHRVGARSGEYRHEAGRR